MTSVTPKSRRRTSAPLALKTSIVALCCCALAGCPPKQDADRPQYELLNEGTGDATWPYWPAAMRVHPLSRIVDDSKSAQRVLLEARIEFTDAWSDPCKCVGQLRFDLFDRDDPTRYEAGVDQFHVDLRDMDANTERWDVVTRTYLFKLQVPRQRIPAAPQLNVYYLGADGAAITTRADVRPYQPPMDAVD